MMGSLTSRVAAIFLVAVAGAGTLLADVEEGTAAFQSGLQAYEDGQFADAAESFERAFMLEPRPSAATNAAFCYIYSAQCDAAVRVLQRLIDSRAELGQDAEVRRLLASRGSETTGAQPCALAVRLDSAIMAALGRASPTTSFEHDAGMIAQVAQRSYDAGDDAAAAAAYEAVFEVHPIAGALFNAGTAYLRAGQPEQAVSAFQRFVAQGEPSVRENQVVAGLILEAERDDERTSVEQCDLASRLHRGIASAIRLPITRASEEAIIFQAARRRYDDGDFSAAAMLYECANQVVPRGASLLNAARSQQAARNWVAALLTFDSYFQLHPEIAAEPMVAAARADVEAEPYAPDERAQALFDRLAWAVERAHPRVAGGTVVTE